MTTTNEVTYFDLKKIIAHNAPYKNPNMEICEKNPEYQAYKIQLNAYNSFIVAFNDIKSKDIPDSAKIKLLEKQINKQIKKAAEYRDDSLNIYDANFAAYYAGQYAFLKDLKSKLGFEDKKSVINKVTLFFRSI